MLGGILAGLAAGALWGLVFVMPRMLGGFSSIDMASGRFVVYGAFSALVMAVVRRGRPLPTPRQAAAALGLSVLGFTGYYTVLVFAIRDAGTQVPALMIGTIPLWVMFLGKPGHLRWATLAPGLLLTTAGLALMMAAPDVGPDGGVAGPDFWRGVTLAAVSLVFWTAFALLNVRWLRRHPEVQATDWANWLGVATGLGALALWLAAGSPVAAMAAQPDALRYVVLSLATGLGSAWLATILWNVASQRLSASLCGQLIVSETLFALLYSFLWDGRLPGLSQFVACVLFTLGILASIRAHR